MAELEENWFGQTNRYDYQDLMIAMYEKEIIDLKKCPRQAWWYRCMDRYWQILERV